MSDCIFCKIASGEIPSEFVYQDEHVLAFNDMHPQAPTHILVIPRTHVSTVNDLDDEQARLMGRLFIAARNIAADQGFAEAGYRTLVNCNEQAGQTVFHIHMHLLAGRPMGWPPG